MKVNSLFEILKLSTHILLDAIHIAYYLVLFIVFKTTLITLAGKHVNLTNYTRTHMYTRQNHMHFMGTLCSLQTCYASYSSRLLYTMHTECNIVRPGSNWPLDGTKAPHGLSCCVRCVTLGPSILL